MKFINYLVKNQFIELNTDEIESALNIAGRHQSIDAPFVEGEDHGLLDVMANDDSPKADSELMISSLRMEIERSLTTLTEREADVLRMFFGIGFAFIPYGVGSRL